MKKNSLVLLALSAVALASCDQAPKSLFNENIELTNFAAVTNFVGDYLQLENLNFNVGVGETADIVMKVIPSTYKTEDIIFTSNNTSVATVDEKGVISGVALGRTTVNVKSIDNKYSYNCNVFVTASKTAAQGAAIASTLTTTLEGIDAPTKVNQIESIEATVLKGGVVQSKTAYAEEICISVEDAYFKVYSDDLNIKAPNGNVEKSSGAWIFYTDEFYETFLFHKTASAKRFCQLNTKAYIGQPRVNAVYNILDMFFVAGSGIATNILEDSFGEDDLEDVIDIATNDYSNVTVKKYGSTNGTDLYNKFGMTFKDQTFKQSEESSGFIAGDKYDAVQELEYFYSDDLLLGLNVSVEESYKVDNEPMVYQFSRSEVYDRNPVLEYPTPDGEGGFVGYAKVSSLYDL